MVKCWFCKTQKGKRYCSPINNVLCPVCCAESRLKRIDCPEDCRYLKGEEYQRRRAEEKEFSELMAQVPHAKQDDIFKNMGVALMAGEIETLVRDIYVNRDLLVTDRLVYDSYKKMYKIHRGDKFPEEGQLDELTQKLVKLYRRSIRNWEFNIGHDMVGQVFLRLMISVRSMSGGIMGEFGYLNFLKNNLGNFDREGFVVEDKFGDRSWHGYDED
jgi:hypothetical protein